LIKDAVKAVLGVGAKSESKIKITPLRIILCAFLVASLFLGTISMLLFLASLIISA